MQKIILFGAGKRLDSVISLLQRLNNAVQLVEIWDSCANEICKRVHFSGKQIRVCLPHKTDKNILILITSDRYEEEMRINLELEYKVDANSIKNWRYLLNDIKEKIILKYKDNVDIQIQQNLRYLKTHDLHTFNNGLYELYKNRHDNYTVKEDDCGLLYSYWNAKKIYLKRSMRIQDVQNYLNNISCEQDASSPHCYLQHEIESKSYDVVIDAGTAEGFFALDRIDNCKMVYLIESDLEWMEALRFTFKPWEGKTIIINKLLGDKDNERCVTLNEIISSIPVALSILIKMDIEGSEVAAIKRANECLLEDRDVAILACSYHNSEDADTLSRLLLSYHFSVRFSNNYMYFLTDEGEINAELRHGLVIATKERSRESL